MSIGGLFARYVWYWEHLPHVLDVRCFSVEGNVVVFIRTPNGHTILIDGGKSDAVLRTLTSLLPFYRRSIDTLILTEPDDTHATGLVSVVDRYHIGRVFEPDFTVSTTSSYVAFEKSVAAQNISRQKLSVSGSTEFSGPSSGSIELDQGVTMNVLFPSTDFPFSKTNTPFLEINISYGNTTFVIGNISKTEQKYITSTSSPLLTSSLISSSSVSVLVMAHGGSKGTVDPTFLTQLAPRYIVISKKPVTAAPRAPKAGAVSSKKKSPPKLPFDILDIPADFPAPHFDVHNLVIDGDAQFISDGTNISYRKL